MTMMTAHKPASGPMEPITQGKEMARPRLAENETTRWMGVDFQAMPTDEAVKSVIAFAMGDPEFSYVVTPNVDHMLRLHDSEAFRDMYSEAGLILNDSRVLQTLAARDSIELPPSPGADIVAGLLEELDREIPISVIGCSSDQIEMLKERYGFKTIHHYEPPMGLRKKPDEVVKTAAFMANHPAAIHFICVGSPQQEMVALAAKLRGDVKGVGLCVGASIDFLTGKVERAPKWLRQARLEWLHRLVSEPRRMTRRYLIDGPRIFKLWSEHRKADKPSSDGAD